MNWKVPLFDPDLGPEESDALVEVIRSKWLTMGDRTQRFEEEFAALLGCRHALAVSSGTTALHLGLLAAGVRPGNEVICPSLTFVATANAIRYCGARPVFADIDSLDQWNVSRATIEPRITAKTKAIVVVHYGGYVCDMGPIVDLAKEHGLAVIEDAAHAPGASRDGNCAGAWGDVGCFSFFSNKNMTTGEGGMVTTDRDDIADSVKLLRSHGMTSLTLDRHKGHAFSYDVVRLGYNYRMGELNAALGLAQLGHLSERNARRGRLVARYRDRLADLNGLRIPFHDHGGESAYHIMPVMLPDGVDRAQVMEALKQAGIQSSIHYRPVDTFTDFRDAGLGPCEYLRHTHRVGDGVVTLPLFPSMGEDSVDVVCAALRNALVL